MTDDVYDILHDLRKYRSAMKKDNCMDGNNALAKSLPILSKL